MLAAFPSTERSMGLVGQPVSHGLLLMWRIFGCLVRRRQDFDEPMSDAFLERLDYPQTRINLEINGVSHGL
jgi:hypothetical protein